MALLKITIVYLPSYTKITILCYFSNLYSTLVSLKKFIAMSRLAHMQIVLKSKCGVNLRIFGPCQFLVFGNISNQNLSL